MFVYLFSQVDLYPDCGIFISKSSMSSIKLKAAGDAAQLVRKVLLEVYGEEILKKMSAHGKRDANKVPKALYDGLLCKF